MLSKINKPKNKNKNGVKQKVMDASEATTSAVPVAPFTDFTNLNTLFQPYYPTSPFFMNPLVLNKATAEHKEHRFCQLIMLIKKKLGSSKSKLETASELISNDDSALDTCSTSEASNNKSKSKRWSSSDTQILIEKLLLQIQL
ncbi:10350_t:CDS:2 [Gigaspora margarita]|uniref:10350_t:CDS:1 n=1 Tax=Gigaspora margarita TaxID=4874 RepID=A0ABN7VFQ7_GIGMA|nr:10350_t:CDS:2 [Gigaspora margarita]